VLVAHGRGSSYSVDGVHMSSVRPTCSNFFAVVESIAYVWINPKGPRKIVIPTQTIADFFSALAKKAEEMMKISATISCR
jgi:hypothetical protein